ncbi:hypothetical protein FRB94_008453 [Tulasnella sp. JGI-2019a]|nr:hypothetical protein FRB94_008453 [Tulasnella sp. JGI-2019a]
MNASSFYPLPTASNVGAGTPFEHLFKITVAMNMPSLTPFKSSVKVSQTRAICTVSILSATSIGFTSHARGVLPKDRDNTTAVVLLRQKQNEAAPETLNEQAIAPLSGPQAQSQHIHRPTSAPGSAAVSPNMDHPALFDQRTIVPPFALYPATSQPRKVPYKFIPPIPKRIGYSVSTSRASLREGPYKPDGVICPLAHPRWAFGCREDKAYFCNENSQHFSLAWLHREGVYQMGFYVYTLGQVCGTRLGMLVVNSAFQRFVLLDDHTIAIETTSASSSSQKSIDELDEYLPFWRQIPNTLLVPSPDLSGSDSSNSNSSGSNSSTLVFHEATQKRYIRFFQSMYYFGAYTVPDPAERYTKALPRELQKLPKPVQDGRVSHLDTFSPGIFTPVPLPTTTSDTWSPARRINITGNGEGIIDAVVPQDKYETKWEAAHGSQGRDKKLFGILTRSSQSPGNDHGGNGDKGGGGEDQVGNGSDQDKDEDDLSDGQPSDRVDGDEDGDGGQVGSYDRVSVSSEGNSRRCRAYVDHVRNDDELALDSHPTPELKPDSSSTSEIDDDTMTTLELYRTLLRNAGVRFRTVNPEEMDRIVHNLTAGRPALVQDVDNSKEIIVGSAPSAVEPSTDMY